MTEGSSKYSHLILALLFIYLSVNVFRAKVLIGNTIFTFPTGDGTEGLAACSTKGVPCSMKILRVLIFANFAD